jgi:Xaa-Pro aminopeptidase
MNALDRPVPWPPGEVPESLLPLPRPAGPARSFPAAEHQARLQRLLDRLRRERLDGALLFDPTARLYYTGLVASNGLLAVDVRRGPVFYTDFRYLAMARRRVSFLPCRRLRRASEEASQIETIARGWKRLGYEGTLSAARFAGLQTRMGGAREWVNADPFVRAQRAVKTPRERLLLRRAVAANDAMLAAVLSTVRPGTSEWEIRLRVRREADLRGQGEAFECIPCVGRHAAECHHSPGEDVLRPGQPLLLDLGLRLDGYCSDLTRTVCYGRPSPLLRDVHAVVLAANRRAVRAIRPGMTGEEVDAVARRQIERAGYGKAFGHGLGHALGLEVHETPSFSPGCREKIRPGMVLTVEPGIYLPGRLGVRIEDVVEVTRTGCRVLSASPRGLAWPGEA